MKYRISKVEFKNYRNFKEEQVINFKTSKRFKDTYENDYVEWTSSKKENYNQVISLLGPNASGKSNVIDLFYVYWKFLNANMMYNPNKNDSKDISTTFGVPFFFNDINKEFEFRIYFESEKVDFCHEIISKIENNQILIKENIKILRTKGSSKYVNETIWSFDESQKSSKLFNNFFMIREAIKRINLMEMFENEKGKQTINFRESEKGKIKRDIFEVLLSVSENIITSNKTNMNVQEGIFGVTNSINVLLENGFDLKKLKTIIKKSLNSIDNKIEDCEISKLKDTKFSQYNSNEPYYIKSLKIRGNPFAIPPEMILSNGTIIFLDHILMILLIAQNGSNERKYLFMDEIGSSWHVALTKVFVDLFKFNVLENITLFFSSHQPEVSDEIRKDGVNVITRSGNITNLSDFRNIRSEIKFSKNYSSEIYDAFNSYPDLSNISELVEEMI
ncbi:AAA family ATPase [Mesoplasma florum]|uniref:AAA family ATPase n=1 Tax=Mesoplasma florum TaxID=2151 RepID=UPI000BE47248|nr:AAA family ATPase [Mesoplasma florum]ATI73248.1 hypothetical protein CQZ69_01565 [Mesoplasma florum]AVN61650.1 hypothetical protein CG004_01565 [Mesoplasma florum]